MNPERVEEVEVLWRNERAVAVAKPAGMHVHRTRLGGDDATLADAVRTAVGRRVFGVHRLDRPASGIVLFGLDGEAAAALHSALAAGDTVKRYIVLVRGIVESELVIDRPLAGRHRSGEAKPSLTRCRPLAVVAERNTVLDVRPETGRWHQIRRHLDGVAHQVIGDTTHGKSRINAYFRESFGLTRIFLHLRTLEITDPTTGERVTIEAPLPPDLLDPLSRMPGFDPQLEALL